MAYIYMDESWDLWFDKTKERTSNYFVITFLITKDDKTPNTIVKKFFKWLKWKNIKIKSWIFHAYKESPENIIKFLNMTTKKDVKIMTLILNKKKIYTAIKDQKHLLYNWAVNVLIDSVITKNLLPNDEKIVFVASRRETSKTLNENFINYLQTKHKDWPNIEFQIKSPEEKWLQIVDSCCFAVFQKYEHEINPYYRIIEKKIIEEKELFE